MNKFSVAAGIALALAAGSALAADLPSMKAPPAYIPPPPVLSWNGLYGGVNIGYGFGADSRHYGAAGLGAWAANHDPHGVLGGGQIGYNYQFSPWLVLGFEADIQAADVNSQRTTFGSPITVGGLTQVNSALSVDWFGTARGRIGVVMPSWPNLMVYGTGGFAYGQVVHTVSVSNFVPGGSTNGKGIYDNTATGWTAGGGVEYIPMSFPSWSLKVEYLYTDLGTHTAGIPGGNLIGRGRPFIGSDTASVRFHTVRAGVNWHFNPFATAPVLAKY